MWILNIVFSSNLPRKQRFYILNSKFLYPPQCHLQFVLETFNLKQWNPTDFHFFFSVVCDMYVSFVYYTLDSMMGTFVDDYKRTFLSVQAAVDTARYFIFDGGRKTLFSIFISLLTAHSRYKTICGFCNNRTL